MNAAHDPKVLALASALAALLRRSEPPPAADAWMAPEASPLGKRRALSLARAGVLPSTKIGRRVLIERAAHDAYLSRHRRGAAAPAEEEEDLFRR